MNYNLIDIDKLPKGATQIARRHRWGNAEDQMYISDDGLCMFSVPEKEDSKPFPVMVYANKRPYEIDQTPVRWLDIGDVLGEGGDYQKIIFKARNFDGDKSKEICKTVNYIHDLYIVRLGSLIWKPTGSPTDMRERRRQIINGKFVTVQIWKESK